MFCVKFSDIFSFFYFFYIKKYVIRDEDILKLLDKMFFVVNIFLYCIKVSKFKFFCFMVMFNLF